MAEIEESVAVARFRRFWMWGLATTVLAASIYFASCIIATIDKAPEEFSALLYKQFPALVLLPFAIGAATVLVILLKHSQGNIEFEVLGFKFSGASGQAVMWLACFLVLVTAIRVLWVSS